VRIKSILRKVAERGFEPGPILPATGPERELMLLLGQLSDPVRAAYEERAPNFLCEFVYNLSQVFSRFYNDCHILSQPDEARRGSWISLATLTLREIELVLSVLGMEVPERM
jgi:arginyl-tRNA synthetase